MAKTRTANLHSTHLSFGRSTSSRARPGINRRWLIGIGLIAGLLVAAGVWWAVQARSSMPKEAPEAPKVLSLQTNMPFQILIPAYLPPQFDRQNADIKINTLGPGGEPMVEITYPTPEGASLFIREWVPVNPSLEILAASHPVETKWGRGWLLKQGEDLIALWVDIGPLRVSIFTTNQLLVDKEHLLAIGEALGPASNQQVFSFIVNPPEIKEAAPPPPVEIKPNAEGVQEVNLIVTPGGYSPLRFQVKKGVKVRLTFRQLGQVGCGNELNFPTTPGNYASLYLKSPTDTQVLEFTPEQVGQFEFHCSHVMYRGIMYVTE